MGGYIFTSQKSRCFYIHYVVLYKPSDMQSGNLHMFLGFLNKGAITSSTSAQNWSKKANILVFGFLQLVPEHTKTIRVNIPAGHVLEKLRLQLWQWLQISLYEEHSFVF